MEGYAAREGRPARRTVPAVGPFARTHPAPEGVCVMGLTRVWVEDGCILCNLCVEVSPEVFVLEGDHCWARPDADLDTHEEEIRQAAIDSPLTVIQMEED